MLSNTRVNTVRKSFKSWDLSPTRNGVVLCKIELVDDVITASMKSTHASINRVKHT